MKYLKKFKELILESDFDNLSTASDNIDISSGPKEKLIKIKKNIDEYNTQNKSKIDLALKSKNINDLKKIEKYISDTNNDFLLKYLNVSKKKSQLEDLTKQISDDNLSKIQSTDILNNLENKDDKAKYMDKVKSISDKIVTKKILIDKLKKEIDVDFNDIKKDMDNKKKEMEKYITYVTNK
jgi:hypothetical protein